MSLSVGQRGSTVATLRFVAVFLMETLARWVPTTPELEAKVVFGQHIWDMARLADALGKRTHELRLPAQHSMRPADEYVALLEEISALEATGERLAAFYDVILPALGGRFRSYLAETDALVDAPTVRHLEAALVDFERIQAEAAELRRELAELPDPAPDLVERLRSREGAVGSMVASRSAAEAFR